MLRERLASGPLETPAGLRSRIRLRQRTIRALGRKDALHASGELDRLIASLARHSERAMVLSDMEAGRLACTRIGGPLLFGRLWERLGLGAVVNELVEGRGFEFALERAVFVSVLHRLFVSGSDRSCEKWMDDYAIPGIDGLRLHHLYRAMSWLGEEAEPAAEGDLAPRCVKDAIEEGLFERRRDLFTEMSLVTPRRCRSTARAGRRWGRTGKRMDEWLARRVQVALHVNMGGGPTTCLYRRVASGS